MAKTVWSIDPVHSEIGFSVKHMMISKAKGTFDTFEGTLKADVDDLENAEIEASIDTASINTNDENRDGHLKSGDFFDVENYPTITFVGKDIQKKKDDRFDVTGDLTMLGTTKEVTLDVTFEGQSKDPISGNMVAGFSGETTINRKEFGLTWNAAVETGGVLVGEDVKINLELELHKQE
ncbi:YceI family protein [Salibacterium qingdaonense]|uniref:Polyisoprenoid-binding protein YceI n=1 Tax=Salibacterium qingdaonense TaxID=266892 RepID=A0A1I4NSP8_9BACI|nr:YceI family protein [Salibacterium qingdaonense]SFM18521.1 Polyisoprenoid-binding protein YceI [Salibacterium qingdaonense]